MSPFDVEDIILTIRTFPIRVEGNSGELKNELGWERLKQIPEFTSVTKKVRRVAEFDAEIVLRAIMSNRPTKIVLNHLDYIEKEKRSTFIKEIEQSINQKIDYIGLDNKCLKKI